MFGVSDKEKLELANLIAGIVRTRFGLEDTYNNKTFPIVHKFDMKVNKEIERLEKKIDMVIKYLGVEITTTPEKTELQKVVAWPLNKKKKSSKYKK